VIKVRENGGKASIGWGKPLLNRGITYTGHPGGVMATRHSGVMELSGKQNAFLDNLALMFLPWFAAMHFGVVTTSLDIFGGYDFSAAIWTVGGIGISASVMAIIFAVAWILGTNELDGRNYESEEAAVLGIALLAPILYVFVPAFADFVNMNGISRLFWTLAVSGAATWIGYSS